MAFILPERLQQGIQESLPVIPNNGNPGGANNMPAAAQEQQAAPPDPYAWLQPSPYMNNVQDLLAKYSEYVDVLYSEMTQPQEKGMYNQVVRDGNFHVQPVDDTGLPLGSNAYTYPVPNDLNESPLRLPLLPGE